MLCPRNRSYARSVAYIADKKLKETVIYDRVIIGITVSIDTVIVLIYFYIVSEVYYDSKIRI